jgi:hypothetical protein
VSETTQPVHRGEINAPGGGRLLPVHEIVRKLWLYRNDRRHRVPIAALADVCALDRSVLYDGMWTGRLSERAQSQLSGNIRWIESGELRFCRVGQVWMTDYRKPPDPLPPPQDRAVRREDWNEWARCSSCGGRSWTLVTMGNRLWYFCDQCRPWQTDGTGARAVERRASPPQRASRSANEGPHRAHKA